MDWANFGITSWGDLGIAIVIFAIILALAMAGDFLDKKFDQIREILFKIENSLNRIERSLSDMKHKD